jgi:hypothetical protein
MIKLQAKGNVYIPHKPGTAVLVNKLKRNLGHSTDGSGFNFASL